MEAQEPEPNLATGILLYRASLLCPAWSFRFQKPTFYLISSVSGQLRGRLLCFLTESSWSCPVSPKSNESFRSGKSSRNPLFMLPTTPHSQDLCAIPPFYPILSSRIIHHMSS